MIKRVGWKKRKENLGMEINGRNEREETAKVKRSKEGNDGV